MEEWTQMSDTSHETPASFRSSSAGLEQSSRLPGFYELPIGERLRIAADFSHLDATDRKNLGAFGAMNPELVDVFIENGVGSFSLPLGIATNFLVNGRDILVPMAVEESSVLAAASHGAKLARSGGGFRTSATEPMMIGQVQLFLKPDVPYDQILTERKTELLHYINIGHERLIGRGGGAKDLTWRYLDPIEVLVVHIHIDTRDAMGANIVNTMAEKLSGIMQELMPCEIGLRILTNLTDQRLAKAECLVKKEALHTQGFDGTEVVERIVKAYEFAYYDPYRAATHNKGIMNGIDPVVIATGNDWRAVEAGAHAWAARSGRYLPMTKWSRTSNGDLHGELEIPMAVGVVGGVTKLHPTAQAALRLLGSPDAQNLAQIIVAVGLAQNLSALRALASEGIQRGHMSLHSKNLDLLRRQGATKS
jgi:hydroxymethylglutaryl-CoA reductase